MMMRLTGQTEMRHTTVVQQGGKETGVTERRGKVKFCTLALLSRALLKA